MSETSFHAYRVDEPKRPATLQTLEPSDLAEGDLLVRVSHSSLNYKDGLAMLGRPGVVRSFPMTCGIDLAGVVVEAAGRFSPGDAVVLTGAELSETRQGGYSQFQRIDSTYAIATPAELGPWGAMAIGTAGLTSMLCVLRLEAAGVTPEGGPVLVTGATGGVGSFAVSILVALGYEVHASTGSSAEHEYLTGLGATEIVDRAELSGTPRPLAKERWAAAVDSVGGATLANVLAQTRYGGAVAACGLAGGYDLPATVMPFILRNVALLGVDSVHAEPDLRTRAWARLATLFSEAQLRRIAIEAPFEELPELAVRILDGAIRGRVVITVDADRE